MQTLSVIETIGLPVIWFIIAVFSFIVEASTVQLVSVWFGVAALVTCVLAAFGVPFWIQILVFAVVSLIALIVSRFIYKKIKKSEPKSDTPDEIADEVAVVTKEIKEGCPGEARTRYEVFTAIGTSDKDTFEVGEKVHIKEVSGNKLIVEKLNQ